MRQPISGFLLICGESDLNLVNIWNGFRVENYKFFVQRSFKASLKRKELASMANIRYLPGFTWFGVGDQSRDVKKKLKN